MRNLLINLTFIFIFVLGSASDAFSQRDVGSIEIYFVGSIEIYNVLGGGNRLADGISEVTVIISSLEKDEIFLEHKEPYTSSNMQITLQKEEIDKLSGGTYLLIVKIEDTLIGKEEIFIE